MGKNFSIRRRLEEASLVLKFITKLAVVYDLTVVGHSKISGIVMEKERLNILCSLAACVAVSHMTYGHLSWKIFKFLLIEDLSHKTITLHAMKNTFRINCRNTTALLSAMLKSVQAIICKACSIFYAIYSKYTAFVVQLIVSIFTITHFLKIKIFYSPRK